MCICTLGLEGGGGPDPLDPPLYVSICPCTSPLPVINLSQKYKEMKKNCSSIRFSLVLYVCTAYLYIVHLLHVFLLKPSNYQTFCTCCQGLTRCWHSMWLTCSSEIQSLCLRRRYSRASRMMSTILRWVLFLHYVW